MKSKPSKRETISKRPSKYIAVFYYFDKFLIILSTATGGISIAFIASVIGAPVQIESASFSFAFSVTTGIIIKMLKTTRNKEKNIIRLLC